ncbi:MAG: ferrochelatase [Oligoflexia bacterium]|nr:ferrochelatase [Oligoflexia bacterium]
MQRCVGCKKDQDRVGILLAQLGTPDAPTAPALRKYLRQFLGDPRVIEVNRALWWVILNGIILVTRPKRSARLYSRIWTEKGSPLMLISRDQERLLKEQLSRLDPSIEVALGMRYGSPSLESAVDQLLEKGCKRILLFPMYPQYCAATTAATYDSVFPHLLKRRWVPTLKVVEPYFDQAAYIDALAARIDQFYAEANPRPERLVLSYHGIPQKYVRKGDPYCCMCTETTMSLLKKIKLRPQEVIHTYQSRFGRDPWLTPYTDETINALAKQGIKHLAVFCPGFTADCLETLDEIGNEGLHAFKEHGGETLKLIPSLNQHPAWIEAMVQIVKKEAGHWLDCGAAGIKEAVNCPVRWEI